MKERLHILKILKQVRLALEKKNNIKIKHLSNKIIHHSSIHQDPDIVATAVIIYSLSKLVERKDYQEEKNWSKFYTSFLKNLNDMISALEGNKIGTFRDEIDTNRKLIQGLSGNLKTNIADVFRRAKINKASRIYEHGISMEKTAKILGVSLWELAEYAGRTRIGDVNLGVTVPIKKRIKYVEDIFS